MQEIDSKDISVVVQGAIDNKITPLCLKSIRKYLPNSEIILSTWKDSNISNLDYDKILLTSDLGAAGFSSYHLDISGNSETRENNVNRQLISTQEGIKHCTKKYILKMRTDFFLSSANFLRFFDSFPDAQPEWKLFSHRVIVPNVCSKLYSPETGFPMPFHPSDFMFFGFAQDIKDYFLNTQPMTLQEASDWTYKNPSRLPYANNLFRYGPEVYYCYSWVKRHRNDIDFFDQTDWNTQKMEYSNNILFSNFIFLNCAQIGLESKKHEGLVNKANFSQMPGFITYDIFLQEYKKRFGEKTVLSIKKGTKSFDSNKIKTTIKLFIKRSLKIIFTPLRFPIRIIKKMYSYLKRFILWC